MCLSRDRFNFGQSFLPRLLSFLLFAYLFISCMVYAADEATECSRLPTGSGKCPSRCSSVECFLNTVCSGDDKEYRCICNEDHKGDRCEEKIDLCGDSACKNGNCKTIKGQRVCECYPGWTGDSCEETLRMCETDACRNGGTCTEQSDAQGIECQCRTGYSGDYCQFVEDKCINVQCQHGGSCVSNGNTAQCLCTIDYAGDKCELPRPCARKPCKNGGICAPSSNTYTCQCASGFTGKNCTEIQDPCANPLICRTGTTCRNAYGGTPLCVCPDGTVVYTRQTCQDRNPCRNRNPCQNGGTCVPKGVDFTCTCPTGYRGKTCSLGGVHRMTFASSDGQVMAGEEVTLVFQSVEIGEKVSLFLNMGDGENFFIPPPRLQDQAEDYIFKHTNLTITLRDPAARYVYLYKHFFNRAGSYALSLTVRNNGILSAEIPTLVNVIPNRNPCFPHVEITNGVMNTTSATQYQRSAPFTILSVAEVPVACKVKLTHEWRFYRLSEEYPIPLPNNLLRLPASVDVTRPFVKIPVRTFEYGAYMSEVVVNVESLSETKFKLMNLDRDWINITESPLTVRIAGGSRIQHGNENNLELNAEESCDPDYEDVAKPGPTSCKPLQKFHWFGKKASEKFVEIPEDMSKIAEIDCLFPQCAGLIPGTGGRAKVIIQKSLLESGITYTFMVIALSDRIVNTKPKLASGSFEQNVTVFNGQMSDADIKCVGLNCATEILGDDYLNLEAVCSMCAAQTTYAWTVMRQSGNDSIVLDVWGSTPKGASTPRSSRELVIKPNILQPGESYSFRVNVTQPGGSGTNIEYVAKVNSKPVGGNCTVYPDEGFALDTHFKVECPTFHDTFLPLQYRFYYCVACDTESVDRGDLLHYGAKPSVSNLLLPAGQPDKNFKGFITIAVTNWFGTSTMQIQEVKVRPRWTSPEEIAQQTFALISSVGPVQMARRSHDYMGAAHLVQVIATQLDDYSRFDDDLEETSYNKTFRTMVRGELLKALQDQPLIDMDASEQMTLAVQELVNVESEISRESQTVAADVVRSSVVFYGSLCRTEPELVEFSQLTSLTRNGLEAVASVRKAMHRSSESLPVTEYQKSVDLEKSNSFKLLEAVDTLIAIHSGRKQLHEEPTKLTAPGLSIQVQRLKPEDISGAIQHGAAKDYINVSELPLADSSAAKDGVILQTLVSDENMFIWDDSRKAVNSPNVQLVLRKVSNQEELRVEHLAKPVRIKLPISNKVQDNLTENYLHAIGMPPKFYSASNMTVHRAEVPVGQNLMASIFLYGTPAPLHIVIKEDSKPVLKDFVTLPNRRTISIFRAENREEFPVFFREKERSPGKTVYYIGIVAGDISGYIDTEDQPKSTDVPTDVLNISFSLSAMSVSCLYMDLKSKSWKGDGCVLSTETRHNILHCDCDHLTTFAGGIFVVPNKIDPISDAKLLLKFFDNPLPVAVVVAIWVIYFILLFYTRHLDQLEWRKRVIHIIPDEDPINRYFYVVTILTGLRPGASTSAKVGVILKGDVGETRPIILNQSTRIAFFRRGGEDSFLIAVPTRLGNLYAMSLWHNGEGTEPQWYVAEIMVRDIQTLELFFFIADRWLAADRDDGQLSTVMVVATQERLMSFPYRFMWVATRGLRDSHIWFSIFLRPHRSTFTRSQRLVCVLTLIFTTMLANIMFYGIPTDRPEDQRSFQGFKLSWTQLMIGVQSALVAVPPNLAITQLFLNAQPPKEKLNMKQRRPNPVSSSAVLLPAMAAIDAISSEPSIQMIKAADSAHALPAQSLIKYKKKTFPHWTTTIAWLIAYAASIVCSYFVALYGMKFGRTKSYEWMASLFTSLFQDTFVAQPIKVVVLSFLLTLVFKSPLERDEEGDPVMLPSDHYTQIISQAETSFYLPPTDDWLQTTKKLAELSRRLQNWLTLLGWFLMFAIATSVFAHSIFPRAGFATHESLNIMFHSKDYGGAIGFEEVRNASAVWRYLNETFFPVYFAGVPSMETDHTATIGEDQYLMADLANFALGPVRLRQVRVKRKSCLLKEVFVKMRLQCHSSYNWSIHEMNDFYPGWSTVSTIIPNHQSSIGNTVLLQLNTTGPRGSRKRKEIRDEWMHRSGGQLEMSPYPGEVETYLGSGYVSFFPHNTSTLRRLHRLRKAGWIDELTRAVFLQFNAYNPASRVINVCLFLFEFHQSGMVIPSYTIHPISFFDPLDIFGTIGRVLGGVALALFIFMTVNSGRRIYEMRWRFFDNPWNVFDLAIICMGLATIVLYFVLIRLESSRLLLLAEAREGEYVSLFYVVLADFSFRYSLAILIFGLDIKLWKILRIHRIFNRFLYVLTGSTKPLLRLTVSFMISCLPILLAGMTVFGWSLKECDSLIANYNVLFQQMLTNPAVSLEEYSMISRAWGPIYFFFVVIFSMWIFGSSFVSVIMTVYSETLDKHGADIEQDGELEDYLGECVRRMLGMRITDPVVDTSALEITRNLQNYTITVDQFYNRPEEVETEQWGDYIIIREIGKLLVQSVEALRIALGNDLSDGAFREDYASYADEWYRVVDVSDQTNKSSEPVNEVITVGHMSSSDPDENHFSVPDSISVDEIISTLKMSLSSAINDLRQES